MTTIRTRYVPATDTKGSRIRATTTHHDGNPTQRTTPLDYALNPPEQHQAAAAALMRVEPESLTQISEQQHGYTYRLECAGEGGYDGNNHSSDVSVVFFGETLGKPLCGFCAMRSATPRKATR